MTRYTNVIEFFTGGLDEEAAIQRWGRLPERVTKPVKQIEFLETRGSMAPVVRVGNLHGIGLEYDTDDLDHAVWFKLKHGGTLRDNGEGSA